MGFALAEVLAEIGCSVFLVTGPTHLTLSHKSIQRYDVTTCDEMYQKCMSFYPDMDIAILAAAVSDYKPEQYATQKIKKKEKDMDIRLVKTKDIAYELGLIKTGSQLNIGFALESENELDNARKKRMDKNFDLIVLNSIRDKGAGFNYDTNKISVINNQNKIEHFELKNKKDVARDIISKICELL
jgi:phosphopantothenoylcysteine decarboxylase/phosphopantothenate--cysteine ligase